MNRRSIEPCLCGDPECPRCFPRSRERPFDESRADEERWERRREQEEREREGKEQR